MLGDSTVIANVAVKDLDEAKQFYAGTLGLTQSEENAGGVGYQSGGGRIFVYQSNTAGTNQATSATWEVKDIEAVVDDLKAQDVPFDHYDIPGATWDGDIAVMGPMRAAWFKDPSGNILSVVKSDTV